MKVEVSSRKSDLRYSTNCEQHLSKRRIVTVCVLDILSPTPVGIPSLAPLDVGRFSNSEHVTSAIRTKTGRLHHHGVSVASTQLLS